MDNILKLLQDNARISSAQIAVMTGKTEAEVEAAIKAYEKQDVIKGYNALINYDKLEQNHVTALIELRVTPKKEHGFDHVAKQVMAFPEVESVYLMSGGYDLSVVVNGDTFQDVAIFVAKRLSTLDSVVSTATHFVLSRYKDRHTVMDNKILDERSNSVL